MSCRARCWGPWTGSLEWNVGLPAEAHHTLARSGRGTDMLSSSIPHCVVPPVPKNSHLQSFLQALECDSDHYPVLGSNISEYECHLSSHFLHGHYMYSALQVMLHGPLVFLLLKKKKNPSLCLYLCWILENSQKLDDKMHKCMKCNYWNEKQIVKISTQFTFQTLFGIYILTFLTCRIIYDSFSNHLLFLKTPPHFSTDCGKNKCNNCFL